MSISVENIFHPHYSVYNQTMTFRQLSVDQISHLVTQEFIELGNQVLTNNLNWKPGDTIVVVTDEHMIEQEARLWLSAAHHLRAPLEIFVLHDMTHSGQEPPDEVVRACGAADVSIFQTSFSLTHTQAGKQAIRNNGRAASLPGASLELLQRTLSVSPTPMQQLGEAIKRHLQASENIHITSTNGTNLTAKIRQHKIYNDCAIMLPGQLGNLPGGEVFFAPIMESANGTVVIDGSIADDILDEPITVQIKSGVVTTITGGKAAQNLQKKLSQHGLAAFAVAEIGIGTNLNASICDNLLEAEKAYGTVHVAFGNSSAIGGENNVPIHLDGLIAQPTVNCDDSIILQNKNFLLSH